MSRTVSVELGERRYGITIAPGLLDQLGRRLVELTGARRAIVITDSNVSELYGSRALAALSEAGLDRLELCFAAGETHKTLATVSKLLDGVLRHSPAIDRKTVIVALGGGVVGDVAGFVAAVALRGLRVVQVPTSLLACVDSSVGGKTGVDHAAGKNLIGAFHQPRAVLIDVDTLRTLPAAELRNGLPECVKHAVIRDASLLDFIRDHAVDLLAGEDGRLTFDAEVMSELISRNVAIKAAVVAGDEHEVGVRSHLNFGHTIGHAVEATIGYDKLRHGEAVALGMIAANDIAVRRDLLSADAAEAVRSVLGALDLPVRIDGLDLPAIRETMLHDKKADAGRLRFILADSLGHVDIYDDVTDAEITTAVKAISC
ncbi:MAG: 3-dehydroquinate synthase [Planctomycetes bacterium]|jgi:3-dehydroquinate synthase|nr:3-dehydroquinate synthase [Planctomycetota bacterium]